MPPFRHRIRAVRPLARERIGGLRTRLDGGLLPGQPITQRPAALNRQQWLLRARRLAAPIAVAVAVLAAGDGFGNALLVGLATLTVIALLLRLPFPLHLVRATRIAIALTAPLLGVGLIGVTNALGSGVEPGFGGALVPILAGAVAGLVVEFAAGGLMARRPIRIAAVGSPAFAAGLQRELSETGIKHAKLLGWINLSAPVEGSAPRRRLYDRIRHEVYKRDIDVIVRGPTPVGETSASFGAERIAEACLGLRVRVIEGNLLYEELFGHVPMGTIDSAWYMFLVHPRFSPPSGFTRRLIDLLVAAPLALLVTPLLALASLAIKLDSRGPVLYRQRRVGAKGKEFDIVKLRTMRTDAEAKGGPQFATEKDLRVTRVGRVLRRLHIDELPQLVNVLRGQMTLVGPRPERPELVSGMERTFPHYRRRHQVKPGVTGWAQVRCGYAGSTLGTAWKVCHDLYYLKHRSLLADLMIMLETVVIAARDSHRPLRVPESQFVFGRELGIDTTEDEAGGMPLPDQAERPARKPSTVTA